MTSDVQSMKDKVKERYGKLADNFQKPDPAVGLETLTAGDSLAASCCGPSGCGPIPTSATDGQLYAVADGVCCSPTGTVDDESVRTRAQSLVSGVPGADVVVNRILVAGTDTDEQPAASISPAT